MVSVIVPAYNVAGYITECVESVCSQSYRNLEIIIVDDGSTDGTDAVCDSFTDNRIIVKHQQNQGLSGARNTGILLARGEYIAFIDSDDFIRETMIEELVANIQNSDADMAACAVEFRRSDTGESSYSGNSGNVEYLDYEKSLDYLCSRYLFNVWNKIYRHSLIEGLFYTVGVVCEDVGYMREVFERLKSSVYIDKPLYVYRVKRPGSSGMTFDARKLPAVDEYEKFINYLNKSGYYKQAGNVKYHQFALIRSLYCETENYDQKNRRKLYHLFVEKMKMDGIWKRHIKSVLVFLIFPGICRIRYRKKLNYEG